MKLPNRPRRATALLSAASAVLLAAGLLVASSPASAITQQLHSIGAVQSTLTGCASSPQTNIQLDDDGSGTFSNTAAEIDVACNAAIDLNGNDLTAKNFVIAAGKILTINDSVGHGSLTVVAGIDEAGIQDTGASLVINVPNSTSIKATGGDHSAGIGGSNAGAGHSDAGTTNILSGTVNATGGIDGAGIGGGLDGAGGQIYIANGVITATGPGGAGIGGGGRGSGDKIIIEGGAVVATGTNGGSGIGGGSNAGVSGAAGPGGRVTINGGFVTATSDAVGIGIGGGAGADVQISSGAHVTAIGGVTAVGAKYQGSPFGSLNVDGTLMLPSGHLVIPDSNTAGNEVTVSSTGRILGATATDLTGAQFTGPGQIYNQGAITLSQSMVTGGAPPPTVIVHHYLVSFNTNGGSAAPASVTLFADTFAHGNRAWPANPTRAGFLFTGWNTAANGSGTTYTATTAFTGGSNGTPVATTLYAQWGIAPAFTGPATVSLTINQPGTWTPMALTGTPAPTVAVTAGTLPAGLTLNAATGVITGTPTGPSGASTVKLTASNGLGTPVTVTVSFHLAYANGGTTPPPFTTDPQVTRFGGADRYATAVEVSKQNFAPGVRGVFIASGLGFADGLTGGPGAAKFDGPVLLTRPGGLPDVVATELARLKPEHIYVLGGTASIDDSTLAALTKFAPTTRLAGPDRYATSAKASGLWTSASTVYVASGVGFADALSGGASAADDNAPLLLTNTGVLPDATAKALTRLAPSKVVLLGGDAAITPAVEAAVKTLLPSATVTRLAGADRYGTSAQALLTMDAHTSGKLMLASGADFADALAGIPAAAHLKTGFALTRRSCLPKTVADALAGHNVEHVYLLGGTASIQTEATTEVCVD